MPSPELEEINDRYRWYRAAVDELQLKSQMEGTPFGIEDYRKLDFFTLTAEPPRVNYTHLNAVGVPAIWAEPVDVVTDRVIEYFPRRGLRTRQCGTIPAILRPDRERRWMPGLDR
jgi:hypothetical protein